MSNLDRRLADVIYRNSFGAFCCAAFEILNPGVPLDQNWHIDFICHSIEKLAVDPKGGRLVINLPPRSLKSFIISVCLPAWLLGRNPSARIVCASYSEELAFKFSRGTRALMDGSFYRKYFRARNSIREKRPNANLRQPDMAIASQLPWGEP